MRCNEDAGDGGDYERGLGWRRRWVSGERRLYGGKRG